MLKKISVIILTYMLVLSGVIVNVSASEGSEFSYWLNGDGIMVTGYKGTNPDVSIPESIDGKTVNKISYFTCQNLDMINTLTIPSSVTQIDGGIPLGVNKIEVAPGNSHYVVEDGVLYSSQYDVLIKCTKEVENLVIREEVTQLANDCFFDSNIVNLTIPETVTGTENLSIDKLPLLKSVKIYANYNYVSFYDCPLLESIYLPKTIERLNNMYTYNIFSGNCKAIKEVIIDEANENYYSNDGIVYQNDRMAYYPPGKTNEIYNIPENITSLMGYLENEYLKEIVFPSGLNDISVDCLIDCPSLNKITINENNSTFKFENDVLYKGSKLIYCLANTSGNKIVVNNDVVQIGDKAFSYNSNVEEIVLPENLESIGNSAFIDCVNLKTINIPKNISTLHESRVGTGQYYDSTNYVFEGCNSITNITVDPTNDYYVIENGGLYTKDYNVLLKFFDRTTENVEINENTQCIEIEAFRACENIESVNLKNVTDILYFSFAECTNLENIIYPNVNNFGFGNNFNGCSSLESVQLPDSYTNGDTLFAIFNNCESLKDIDLNSLENYYERSIFDNCPLVKKMVLPKSINYMMLKDNSGIVYYVYDNSYAKENIEKINAQIEDGTYWEGVEPFKYKVINELNDGTIGIIVDTQKNDNTNENTILTTSQIESGKDFDLVSDTFNNFVMYDIVLTNNGQNVAIDEECEVKIPIPKDMDIDNCKIYCLDENNQYVDMNAEYKDGYMVFKTVYFGEYIITDSEFISIGDINDDGLVSYNDAVLVLQADSKLIELTETQRKAADVNQDGIVNYNDAVQILRKDAGLITDF